MTANKTRKHERCLIYAFLMCRLMSRPIKALDEKEENHSPVEDGDGQQVKDAKVQADAGGKRQTAVQPFLLRRIASLLRDADWAGNHAEAKLFLAPASWPVSRSQEEYLRFSAREADCLGKRQAFDDGVLFVEESQPITSALLDLQSSRARVLRGRLRFWLPRSTVEINRGVFGLLQGQSWLRSIHSGFPSNATILSSP